MQVILKIGYYRIWLPDDTGVSTVMKCLARGREVKEHHRSEGKMELGAAVEVGLEALPGYRVVKTPKVDRPEMVSPDEVLDPVQELQGLASDKVLAAGRSKKQIMPPMRRMLED